MNCAQSIIFKGSYAIVDAHCRQCKHDVMCAKAARNKCIAVLDFKS